MKEITNWDRVEKHTVSKVEENIISKLLIEYFEGNDVDWEDMSQPEVDFLYSTFKHGYIMAQILSEGIE